MSNATIPAVPVAAPQGALQSLLNDLLRIIPASIFGLPAEEASKLLGRVAEAMAELRTLQRRPEQPAVDRLREQIRGTTLTRDEIDELIPLLRECAPIRCERSL